MNTTIIIVLGALILIVVIAIVVILIKGKDPDEVSQDSNPSGKTFQEDSLKPPKEATQEPKMTSPQLHKKDQGTAPQTPPQTNKAPVMGNLATPKQPSTTQTSPMGMDQPTQPPTADLDKDMYKSNPLPDESKINSDLANLQKSSSQPSTPKPPTPDITTTKPTPTEPDPKDNMQNITNDIKSVLEAESKPQNVPPTPQPPIQPNTVTQNSVAPNSVQSTASNTPVVPTSPPPVTKPNTPQNNAPTQTVPTNPPQPPIQPTTNI